MGQLSLCTTATEAPCACGSTLCNQRSHRNEKLLHRSEEQALLTPVFPALFRLSSRGTTHNTVARGTLEPKGTLMITSSIFQTKEQTEEDHTFLETEFPSKSMVAKQKLRDLKTWTAF